MEKDFQRWRAPASPVWPPPRSSRALRSRRIDRTSDLVLRSYNGLVFGAKAFVAVARRYRLTQEYITPFTPQQNRMIERFFYAEAGTRVAASLREPRPRLPRRGGLARSLRQ